jgi:branched-chain amino acid transport system ATP-binding protein
VKLLELIDIHTYYGDSYILQGVCLEVAPNSVVALLGRNGMGKTTTIRSIIGFTPPQRGIVRFKDSKISGLEPYRIVQMGITLVPQGRRIFPSLSVRENLVIAFRNWPIASRAWDLDRVLSLFPRLQERLHYQGNSLSGGELQMLAIGRALMGNPELLLMDEPSEGLAPLFVRYIETILQELRREKGFSILLVEQTLRLAFGVADYVYIMSKGKVVFQSKPDELKDNEEVKVKHLGV